MEPKQAALVAHFSAKKHDAFVRLQSLRQRNVAGLPADERKQLIIQLDLAEAEYLTALNNLAEVKP